jgi:threonine dehydrogenase-like Zn-dependent dehydrogenase
MYNSNNLVSSKDIAFKTKNLTNVNSISNNAESLGKISFTKVKEVLQKDLLTPRELIQVLSNLEAIKEAIEIFKQRNVAK